MAPFQLRYELKRAQRFVPLMRIWGWFYGPFALLLLTFFCLRTVYSVLTGEWPGLVVFGGLALFTLAWVRGLVVGLVDVLFTRRRTVDLEVCTVDLEVEEQAVGVLRGGERCYLFLDGFLSLDRFHPEVWTLQHYNGSVLHIPVSMITEEQLDHFRTAMARGRTPEGIRAVVERGRRIEEITRSGGA